MREGAPLPARALSGRVRAVTGHTDTPINERWQLASSAPGSIADPEALACAPLAWTEVATVPTTAAAALAARGQWSIDGPTRRFDAEDWWWKTTFDQDICLGGGAAGPSDEVVLCFDGIATLAEVWLDGERILESDNMFARHEVAIKRRPKHVHELVICCRSIDARLAMKKPRPRWRAPMIEHAQLRWIRTTLLGRTPGWSPPAAVVGPWRPVHLVCRRSVAVDDLSLHASVEGSNGVLDVAAHIRNLDDKKGDVTVILERNGVEHRAALIDGKAHLVIPNVDRWWPHTHGLPALYAARIATGDVTIDLGNVGFRTIEAKTDDNGFTLYVNNTRIFCRGACWTPLDVVTLCSDDVGAYEAAIAQVTNASMNMLRLSGAMSYETNAFFDAADAAGVLVWQDLMFANMDYPEDDPAFALSVDVEVRQQLARLEARPSIAVVCGNSEGEQQAAMFGASRDRWSPPLFHETFAKLSRSLLPDVPYWPSSAHGGPAFPHQVDHGTTSYYGVGAYERALDDARRSDVRFATECLAFANVPAPKTMAQMPGGGLSLKAHHPGWKARTPRDLGAGWDFDDTRDHYVARLFNQDIAKLRYSDHERYLALGRVITGEVMAQTFGEWRRAQSKCGGGLVWFLRDLWAGAGWGVLGSDGEPKAAYHYLRRALKPIALHISDEANNGLYVHIFNDTANALSGELEIILFRHDAQVGRATAAITVDARSAKEIAAVALFDGFMDLNHAFRFGPPTCDLVVARFNNAETFHFPVGLPSTRSKDLGLTAELKRTSVEGSAEAPANDIDVILSTKAFAQSVAIEIDGYAADDDFFHLAPGASKTVRLRPCGPRQAPRGNITPLNADVSVGVVLPK